VRHPRCVGSITKNFVYYTYSGTQLYFTQQYSRNTTTCFGPIGGPSSGCDLTYRAAVQDVWGVFWGCWGLGGGEEGQVGYYSWHMYVGWSFNSLTDFFVSEWVDLTASWSCLLRNSVLVLVCAYSSASATYITTNDNPPVTALGHVTHYCNNEISFPFFPHPIPNTVKNTPHILYSYSVSQITTWRWPTYRAETCSCIPTVLLGEI